MNFVSIKLCYELIGHCMYHMHSVPINYSSVPNSESICLCGYLADWEVTP